MRALVLVEQVCAAGRGHFPVKVLLGLPERARPDVEAQAEQAGFGIPEIVEREGRVGEERVAEGRIVQPVVAVVFEPLGDGCRQVAWGSSWAAAP